MLKNGHAPKRCTWETKILRRNDTRNLAHPSSSWQGERQLSHDWPEQSNMNNKSTWYIDSNVMMFPYIDSYYTILNRSTHSYWMETHWYCFGNSESLHVLRKIVSIGMVQRMESTVHMHSKQFNAGNCQIPGQDKRGKEQARLSKTFVKIYNLTIKHDTFTGSSVIQRCHLIGFLSFAL